MDMIVCYWQLRVSLNAGQGNTNTEYHVQLLKRQLQRFLASEEPSVQLFERKRN